MAVQRSLKQRREVAAFIDWLRQRSGAGTDAEFAGDAGVSPVSFSTWHTAKAVPDGYNLLRLIRAAGVLEEPELNRGPGDAAQIRRALTQAEQLRKLAADLEERLRSVPGS